MIPNVWTHETFVCPTDTIIYQKTYSLVNCFLLHVERILPLNFWLPYIKSLLQLICILFMKRPLSRDECAVGAQITKIQIQNPFKIQKFWCLDLGWFYIKIIVTIATAIYIIYLPVHRNLRWPMIGYNLKWSGCSVL